MRPAMIASAAVAVLALSACEREAKPDSYWLEHEAEAKTQIKECKEKEVDLGQEVRTKPPEALSAEARECLYLMGGKYQRDLRGGERTSILD